MKTIHIIQTQHANDLKKQLLSDHKALINTEVLPFDVAFNLKYNKHETMLIAYRRINNLDLAALHHSANNPLNIEDYLRFIRELKLYALTPEHLPTATALEIDNKKIITALFDLIPDPVVSENVSYHAYNHFLSHAETHFLNHHKIEINSFNTVKPNTKYQKTLNIRHEFESVLQEIITQDYSEATFIVPSLSDRYPLIESIMNRYGFNVKLQNRHPLLVKKKFISLLQFLREPNQKHLIDALENHAFGFSKNMDLIYLIKTFDLNHNHLPALSSQNKDIQLIITRSLEDYESLQGLLTSITWEIPFKEAVVQAYDILRNVNRDDISSLQNYIEEYLTLYDDETAHLFLFHYEKTSSQALQIDHFSFYDLNDFSIEVQDHVYAIDMNSKNFPAVSSNTGVLDDSYRTQVSGYPSLEERTQHTLINKNTFLGSSKNLTLSYAYTNYEGKGQEPSFELFGSEDVIPIAPVGQRTTPYHMDMKLHKNLVAALIMENGKFSTSISALETYQKDPLLFFTRYVLKYYELEYPTFGPLHLGNINHDAIEHHLSGVDRNNNLWDDFPASTRLEMIKIRNEFSMEQNYRFIDESIKSTKFKPSYFEHSFAGSDLFKGFQIGGKVDRIDTYGDFFLIYDYKSSPTSLSSRKIQNGEQLQLLTYGFILERILGMDMAGVYYYGLRSQNMLYNTNKYTRGAGITPESTEYEFDWVKKRQYMGILFEQIGHLFDYSIFHQRLAQDRKNPEVIKLSRQPYNKETTFQVLKDVYQRFHDSLSNGIFEPYLVRQALRPEFIIDLQKSLKEEDDHAI